MLSSVCSRFTALSANESKKKKRGEAHPQWNIRLNSVGAYCKSLVRGPISVLVPFQWHKGINLWPSGHTFGMALYLEWDGSFIHSTEHPQLFIYAPRLLLFSKIIMFLSPLICCNFYHVFHSNCLFQLWFASLEGVQAKHSFPGSNSTLRYPKLT